VIKKFANVGNAALAVTVGAFALAMNLGKGSSTQSIWGPGGAPEWLAFLAGGSIFLMFWAYAKSKGRSGWLGLLLPFLNIIGLIILLKLEDHSGRSPDIECSKCGGKNVATDKSCRYCKSDLQQASA
jgi:hypothetical protein